MVNAKLVTVGGAKLSEVQLKQLPATIGRARNSTITLPHNLVSRKHCEIFEEGGLLFVRDLNSLNGTYLNNEKICGTHSLLPNQLLTLGNVTFRVVFPDVPSIDNEDTPDEWKLGETIPDEFENLRPPMNGQSFRESDSESDVPHAAENGLIKKHDDVQFNAHERDTDKSNGKSADARILIFDDEATRPDKSVSFGALEKLPNERPASASFAGGIHLPANIKLAALNADPVQIDLGDDRVDQEPPSQSSIDSFVRKLPK